MTQSRYPLLIAMRTARAQREGPIADDLRDKISQLRSVMSAQQTVIQEQELILSKVQRFTNSKILEDIQKKIAHELSIGLFNEIKNRTFHAVKPGCNPDDFVTVQIRLDTLMMIDPDNFFRRVIDQHIRKPYTEFKADLQTGYVRIEVDVPCMKYKTLLPE